MREAKWLLLLVLGFSQTLWAIDCKVRAERRFEDWSPQWLSSVRDGNFTPLVLNLTDNFARERKTSLTIESTDPRCASVATVLGSRSWDGEVFLEYAFVGFPFKWEGRGIVKISAPAPVGTLVVEYRETAGNLFRVLKTQRIPLKIECDGPFHGQREESSYFPPAVYALNEYPRSCTFSAKNFVFETIDAGVVAISFAGGAKQIDEKGFAFRIDRLEVK